MSFSSGQWVRIKKNDRSVKAPKERKCTALQWPVISHNDLCSWNDHAVIQANSFYPNQQNCLLKQPFGLSDKEYCTRKNMVKLFSFQHFLSKANVIKHWHFIGLHRKLTFSFQTVCRKMEISGFSIIGSLNGACFTLWECLLRDRCLKPL